MESLLELLSGADPGFQKGGGGGVDGRPYLLRGGRENALTKKINKKLKFNSTTENIINLSKLP